MEVGTAMADRRVHAVTHSGAQIARYDRAGKWFVEEGGRRKRITFREAVWVASATSATVYLGVPGGSRFDAALNQSQGRA